MYLIQKCKPLSGAWHNCSTEKGERCRYSDFFKAMSYIETLKKNEKRVYKYRIINSNSGNIIFSE